MDIDHFYRHEVQHQLAPLEAQRIDIRNKILIAGGIAVVLALPLAVGMLIIGEPLGTLIIGGGAFFVGYEIAEKRLVKPYIARFKHDVITQLVNHINPDFEYQPDYCIDSARFQAAKIYVKRFDKYSGSDYIAGTIGRTKIEFSQIQAMKKSGDSYDYIFQGLFYISEFKKNFDSPVIVLSAHKLSENLRALFKYNPTELENPDFENVFNVYCEDEIEARYILTPVMMERLIELDRIIKDQSSAGNISTVSLSFVDNKMYVAIPHLKELFKPRIFGDSITTKQDIAEFYGCIMLITSIVEELELNTRIWSRV